MTYAGYGIDGGVMFDADTAASDAEFVTMHADRLGGAIYVCPQPPWALPEGLQELFYPGSLPWNYGAAE